jgi:hypothetical protein
MATLYVSWYGVIDDGIAETPISTSVLDTSAVSAKTSTAPANAKFCIVTSDTAHYVAVGPQATVTASVSTGAYLPANGERPIGISSGDAVAAVTV